MASTANPPVGAQPAGALARHDLRRGALLLTASALFMACVNALQKHSGSRLNVVEILFFRNLLSLPIVLAVAARGTVVVRTHRIMGHVVRSAIGLTSMAMVVVTVTRLPLAEQQILSYTQPLFMVLLSAVLLGERSSLQRVVAVGIGFVGIVVAAGGGSATHPDMPSPARWVICLGLAQGAAAALSTIQVRQLSATERTTTITIWQAVLMTVIASIGLPFVWTTPKATDWVVLLAIGLFAGAAQLLQTEAYASARIAAIGPFGYSGLLWASLLGWIAYGERPGLTLLVGGLLVLLGGLWTVAAERIHNGRMRKLAP